MATRVTRGHKNQSSSSSNNHGSSMFDIGSHKLDKEDSGTVKPKQGSSVRLQMLSNKPSSCSF